MSLLFEESIRETSKILLGVEYSDHIEFNVHLLNIGWFRIFPKDDERSNHGLAMARSYSFGFEQTCIVATRRGYFIHDPQSHFTGEILPEDGRYKVSYYFTNDPEETAKDFWDRSDEHRVILYGHLWRDGELHRRVPYEGDVAWHTSSQLSSTETYDKIDRLVDYVVRSLIVSNKEPVNMSRQQAFVTASEIGEWIDEQRGKEHESH